MLRNFTENRILTKKRVYEKHLQYRVRIGTWRNNLITILYTIKARSLEGRRTKYLVILSCFFGKSEFFYFLVIPIKKWLKTKLLQIKIVTYFFKMTYPKKSLEVAEKWKKPLKKSAHFFEKYFSFFSYFE